MTIITKSDLETEKAGQALGQELCPGTVVAFYGDLGAGKTTFIRGMAKALGVKEPVTSPTYTIVNEYDGEIPLFHFDMYRLASSEDLFEIGWEDYTAKNGILAVEWSEHVEDAFEGDIVRVRIEKDGGSRIISIER